MSLWADGEKKNGKRSIYSISPDPLTWLCCAPILLALLLPVIQLIRTWFR